MQDYPFEEMGPTAFEQLAVALSARVINANITAFGSGRDGGREATFHGEIDWGDKDSKGKPDTWKGYTVIQAKMKENYEDSPSKNLNWLKSEIRKELDRWSSTDSRRGEIPDNIVFVTNVRLSSVAKSGGNDEINSFIEKRIKDNFHRKKIRRWKVWHRDQLVTYLNAYESVRKAFPAFLTAGDMMARVTQLIGPPTEPQILQMLLQHAVRSVQSDRRVYFSEAQHGASAPLESIIVDLPLKASDSDQKSNNQPLTPKVLRHLIDHADKVHKKDQHGQGPNHRVITGAPGNGKSTISKFIVQLYRARLLADEDLPLNATNLINQTEKATARIGIPFPKHKRWPIRIDLAEYAEEYANKKTSLIRWMSEAITSRIDDDLKASHLKSWLNRWPTLIVLDGLDEVTAPGVRSWVINEIENLKDEADQYDYDMIILVTTRPTGYSERIAPESFAQIDLDYLSIDDAKAYSRTVTRTAFAGDPDQQSLINRRWDRAFVEGNAQRLMRTPLQIMIMVIILGQHGSLPGDRYQLFWRYYETIYSREGEKSTSYSRVIREEHRVITTLHERVGLLLQVESETDANSKALLSLENLAAVTRNILIGIGHEPGVELERTVSTILEISMKRLVLLTPSEENTVSFELRSLQELMAARALSWGNNDVVMSNLMSISRSPHWRNTWLFIAGRVFVDRDQEAWDSLTSMVENLDDDPYWPGWIYPIGPELAAAILDDGFTARAPKWHSRIINVCLRVLDGYCYESMQYIAPALEVSIGDNKNWRMQVNNSLRVAFSSTPRAKVAAALLCKYASFGPSVTGSIQVAESVRYMGADWNKDSNNSDLSAGELMRQNYDSVDISPDDQIRVDKALDAMDKLPYGNPNWGHVNRRVAEDDSVQVSIYEALRHPGSNDVLRTLFESRLPEYWPILVVILKKVRPLLDRESPVANLEKNVKWLCDFV